MPQRSRISGYVPLRGGVRLLTSALPVIARDLVAAVASRAFATIRRRNCSLTMWAQTWLHD
jgi:hypothetical protein